ncbi:MAG: hypothetical protein NZ606_07465, partial [Candidatus Kapabacteria bacterium]|nr:hypothetical protein [Candidatus Kapabacteria bacterium]
IRSTKVRTSESGGEKARYPWDAIFAQRTFLLSRVTHENALVICWQQLFCFRGVQGSMSQLLDLMPHRRQDIHQSLSFECTPKALHPGCC